MQSYDKRQILIWTVIIFAIIGLFIGLAILGGGSGTPSTTNSLAVAVDPATDHIKGPSTAKATLVEYSDFQCPACGQYEPIIREVASSFPNDLQIVYRHFPLMELHPNAMPSAIASEAAAKQGKFWEYHDMLFDRQSQWVEATSTDKLFTEFAKDLGINTDQFQKDLTSIDTTERVGKDITSGNASGINATPTFYLNGSQIHPQSLGEFKSAVQKILETTK